MPSRFTAFCWSCLRDRPVDFFGVFRCLFCRTEIPDWAVDRPSGDDWTLRSPRKAA